MDSTKQGQSKDGVLVPKWALLLLAGCLSVAAGVALLGFGYWMGSQSARAIPPEPTSPAPGSYLAGERSAPAVEAATPNEPSPPVLPAASQSSAVAPQAAEPTLPTPVTGPTTSGRRDIATYLAEFERIQDSGSAVTDPREFATALLQQSQSGDQSGLDDLVKRAEKMERDVRALKAPPECAAHQKLGLDLSQSALALLRRLRAAMASQDLMALTSIAAEGSTLETQAKTLQQETERLRALAR